jgi:ABC-type phosphate transport system substrate-binding protein
MGRLIAALVVAALVAPAQAGAATLSFSGSTPTGAVVADLAYFYRHEARRPPRFSIVGGGSGTGIADAARGIVSAGLASRPLDSGDPRGLVYTPFAISGVCLVTNVANPLANLTRPEVQDLVADRDTSWSQVPGSTLTAPITPVALDPSGGAPAVFQQVFVDLATPVAYTPRTFQTAAQVRDFIAATPSAWGYVDLVFSHGLHVVDYEGVPCTRATIASSAYPAHRPLGFVTRGRPRGDLARFVRWVTHSRTAQRVIATRYVLPG